ncbi:transcription initiation factor TFIID subunit 11-like [Papaver somniferum]|uniref:transcription initiation factor TFIID subunit 11-like n=1 Tax=Papaver somniferum TaxID=3469 RepID=UPI000E701DD6|nr:transcription initiation factor TFIID subunit 11-like [Papaver somniferum]
MAGSSNSNQTNAQLNAGEGLPIVPPESPEYAQAESLLSSLGLEELQKLRIDVQDEIDHQIREQIPPRYESATESDSEASEGFQYNVEEIDTNDLDSDAAEDKHKMEAYHEGKLKRRFEYELDNPKIFRRTMNEGESSSVNVRMLIAKSDEDDTDEEGSGGSSEDTSSSSETSPAPSDSDDSEFYEEEGWGTDEEDLW